MGYSLRMFHRYLREMKQNLGYFATWLPNVPLDVGAIGVVDKDGRFRPETSLQQLKIPAPVVTGKGHGPIQWHSASDVSIDFKAAGHAPVMGSALTAPDVGVSIGFASKHAVAFGAVGCTIDRLADVEDVGIELIQRADAHLWKAEYIVITEIVRASSTTVLISDGKQARFDATISGHIPSGSVSIGDASLALTMKSSNNVGLQFVAEKDLTPLFSAYRVKSTWFSGGRWVPARGVFDRPLEEVPLDQFLQRQE